ncbi:hypothetical protein VTI28DRAFT_8192 [Corynascus sepedonium]
MVLVNTAIIRDHCPSKSDSRSPWLSPFSRVMASEIVGSVRNKRVVLCPDSSNSPLTMPLIDLSDQMRREQVEKWPSELTVSSVVQQRGLFNDAMPWRVM